MCMLCVYMRLNNTLIALDLNKNGGTNATNWNIVGMIDHN